MEKAEGLCRRAAVVAEALRAEGEILPLLSLLAVRAPES